MSTVSTTGNNSIMHKLHPLGLNEPATGGAATPRGDGVDKGNGFLARHPYAAAAVTGATVVGVPVFLLTKNLVATGIAAAAGAVAGVGVRFAHDVMQGLDSAF